MEPNSLKITFICYEVLSFCSNIDSKSSNNWHSEVNNIQNMWDEFESKLVKLVDKITPLTQFINCKVKIKLPNSIKNKIKKEKGS